MRVPRDQSSVLDLPPQAEAEPRLPSLMVDQPARAQGVVSEGVDSPSGPQGHSATSLYMKTVTYARRQTAVSYKRVARLFPRQEHAASESSGTGRQKHALESIGPGEAWGTTLGFSRNAFRECT